MRVDLPWHYYDMLVHRKEILKSKIEYQDPFQVLWKVKPECPEPTEDTKESMNRS